jgi:NAD(P)-dependent dehydrogenase (short-subunit alcohol dehydrogenase family)
MATALVTGANRGIGLSFAKLLKARGDEVIAACRRETPELTALGVESFDGVDVASDKSLNILADKLKGRRIDVLVNNAGLLAVESFDERGRHPPPRLRQNGHDRRSRFGLTRRGRPRLAGSHRRTESGEHGHILACQWLRPAVVTWGYQLSAGFADH